MSGTTPEAEIKRAIRAYLDGLGCWAFAPMSFGYGRRGVPDIIGCYRGRLVAIEVKRPGREPDPWQARELAAIAQAGGLALTARSLDEVMQVIG